MSTRYRIFLAVAPGLEDVAAAEAADVLAVRPTIRAGGVELEGDGAVLRSAVTRLRVPDGVRVRIASFTATDFAALEIGLKRVQWHAWLSSLPTDVSVTCRKSALYHSGAVRERVERDIAERLRRVDDAEPSGTIYIRLDHDRVTVSVDATGERAHVRGFDKHVARGGLRDTLAAGVVAASGTAENAVLWDPFCGAGTIGFEWLRLRCGLPVFGEREFAMDRWPARASWPDPEEDRGGGNGLAAGFVGSDRSAKAVAAARRNAIAAGLDDRVSVQRGDVIEAAAFAPERAAVVTNLPYGRRVGGARPAMAAFGEMLRSRPDLGPVVAVDGTGRLPAISGLPWTPLVRFTNRGIGVTAWRLDREPS